MTRSFGWFALALTAACSSESPADDDMAGITSADPSASTEPTNTGSTPGPATTPATQGTPAQTQPVGGPMTMTPATAPRPPMTSIPQPMPQPMPSMTVPLPMDTGAGGDSGMVTPVTGGAGGAEGPSSGGEVGAGGSVAEGGGGGTDVGGAPMEETGGAMSGGAGGAPVEDGGECTVGTTTGNEVVIIGESFIAASSIGQDLSNIAIENGSLEQGDSYINNSVSGTRLGDGAIPGQYTRAAESNDIRFVLMDGGGNDCLQANDSNSPITAANDLFAQMAEDGVEKVVYFFYPDPAGMFGGPTSSLKTCLDELRPKMKEVCDGLTSPKCYWLDLRETSWTGNESAYTSDGIHPNAEGSQVTAEAIWEVMVENCVAQ